jgi:molybdenum cofactor synthesis domain-containing protein
VQVTTVAALIIGDEILSGKVRDTNAPLIIDLFRELGVQLCRLVYVCDSVDEISAEVRSCAEKYDAVITSGGVGPTHDDCTVDAIARAFGVKVVRHPDIEALIRAYWGERMNDAALRMAEVPEGSRLLYSTDGMLPLVVFRNIYLFPGVPRLFAAKVGALRDELRGEPVRIRNLYLTSDESRVAPLLGQVDQEFPEVKIGSYPRIEAPDHRLWITVEAASDADVDSATRRLLELLPDDEVVRVDD